MNKIEKIIDNLFYDLSDIDQKLCDMEWFYGAEIKKTHKYQLLNLKKSWIELKIKILESF